MVFHSVLAIATSTSRNPKARNPKVRNPKVRNPKVRNPKVSRSSKNELVVQLGGSGSSLKILPAIGNTQQA